MYFYKGNKGLTLIFIDFLLLFFLFKTDSFLNFPFTPIMDSTLILNYCLANYDLLRGGKFKMYLVTSRNCNFLNLSRRITPHHQLTPDFDEIIFQSRKELFLRMNCLIWKHSIFHFHITQNVSNSSDTIKVPVTPHPVQVYIHNKIAVLFSKGNRE